MPAEGIPTSTIPTGAPEPPADIPIGLTRRPGYPAAMRIPFPALLLAALAAACPAEADRAEPGRSAVLVTRSLTPEGKAFAERLTPALASRAAESGVAVSPAASSEAGEDEQVAAARARGASFLLEARVTSFAATTTSLLGENRRRMTAAVAWRGLAISGNPEAAGAGQRAETSVAEATLPAEEQAAALAATLAEKVGAEMAERLAAAPVRAAARVAVAVRVTADGLSLPSLAVDAEGRVSAGKEALPLELGGFTVTCDGVALGTAPAEGSLGMPAGLRTLAITRPGFEPWTARVDVREGLRLEPALRPSAEGLARWREQLGFLRSLADGAKLADAEVERVRAAAEALRNSGFRTNIDVKVDAKELPETVVVPAAR